MIYLLEDDDSIRKLVVYTLNSQGIEAQGFGCPADFHAAMKTELPDLILMDVMLPEESGLDILKRLRSSAETAMLPVIMLTARSSEYDRVIGLDSGADDYIPKPFGMMELIARIRAVLRRSKTNPEDKPEAYCLQGLSLYPNQHRVEVNGQEIPLTLKEFDLLYALFQVQGQVLTRNQLLNQIWGYEFINGTSRTVDVHIRSLRQKLGAAGGCIETVRGVGYRIGNRES